MGMMEPRLKRIVCICHDQTRDHQERERRHGENREADANRDCGARTDQASSADADHRDVWNYQEHGPTKLLDVSPSRIWRTT